ncbi:MAG TPA: ABC transporter ATP-binding protein [Firmicutes bacterium]|nr:ABC transporter ATP-binding protein [Bacillota bacterium]
MIEVRNLAKHYKRVRAVDGISFRVEEGDIFGFIGPNGAGKTTTIKILATLLLPTSGVASVGGYDVVSDSDKVRQMLGYMPDYFGVYNDLLVWEYLDFFAAAYKIPRTRRVGIIDDVLQLTDLVVKKDSFVAELSKGMKQRLCLARTLIHNPKVLILDEPASGLDPRARIEMRELLKELKNMGKTVFISSHILTELSDFCNKVGIIEAGKMVVSGDVDEILKAVSQGQLVTVRVPKGQTDTVISAVRSHAQVLEARALDDDEVELHFDGAADDLPGLMQHLLGAGVKVLSFKESVNSLEDIFMKVTKGQVN